MPFPKFSAGPILLLILLNCSYNPMLALDWEPIEEDRRNETPPVVSASVEKNSVSAEISNLRAILKPVKSSKKGNVVSLVVYMEAQCPDTTGFMKRQLVPTWEKLGFTNRINVTIWPFGKAHCARKDDDFECECQHGVEECNLNVLMNCAIERLAEPNQFIPMLGCIQGKTDIQTAFQSCVTGHPEAEWLWKCAHSKHGRNLHFLAGEQTDKLGPDFNFVPWVVIDRKRVNDAFYALLENLCNRLDPKPIQCEHFV